MPTVTTHPFSTLSDHIRYQFSGRCLRRRHIRAPRQAGICVTTGREMRLHWLVLFRHALLLLGTHSHFIVLRNELKR